MKVFFLIRSLNYGGAERQVITLANGLYKQGFNVGVIVFYSGGQLEKGLNVPIFSLKKHSRWDVFGFFLRLVSLLKKEKPDILNTYLVEPNILGVILKPFFPKIKIVWGIRASNMDLSKYDWFCRLTFRIQAILSKFPDLIIANSKAGIKYHLKHQFPKEKMMIIPNGIDTERFYPDYERGKKLRRELGINENEKLIGLVARLDPMKDHITFLKAAGLLAKEMDNVRFVCVGDGPLDYQKKLDKLSEEIGLANRIHWLGSRENMLEVYNMLDILTSSSFGEGFSNVIGEAMACGVPAVVTDVGDSSWIVEDTGIVVEPKNPHLLKEGWKAIIKKLDEDPSLPKRCRERIVSFFSSELLVEKTSKALFGLL